MKDALMEEYRTALTATLLLGMGPSGRAERKRIHRRLHRAIHALHARCAFMLYPAQPPSTR